MKAFGTLNFIIVIVGTLIGVGYVVVYTLAGFGLIHIPSPSSWGIVGLSLGFVMNNLRLLQQDTVDG
jgi:hypothetical protein